MITDKNPKKVISVDFDGVVNAYTRGWNDGKLDEEPVHGAADALKRLVDSGYTVVIFTARLEHQPREMIEDWLWKNGIDYGTHYHDITDRKVAAIAYIDDRGIRFTNWPDILKYFAWTI
jgi:hypothetical protein